MNLIGRLKLILGGKKDKPITKPSDMSNETDEIYRLLLPYGNPPKTGDSYPGDIIPKLLECIKNMDSHIKILTLANKLQRDLYGRIHENDVLLQTLTLANKLQRDLYGRIHENDVLLQTTQHD